MEKEEPRHNGEIGTCFLSLDENESTLIMALPSFYPNITTQSQLIVNPKPFLADLTGKHVRIRLKWGQVYQGRLASSDAYMNLQLEDTEEFIDGQFAGALGEVLIRCNNVLYIKAADLKGGQAAMDE